MSATSNSTFDDPVPSGRPPQGGIVEFSPDTSDPVGDIAVPLVVDFSRKNHPRERAYQLSALLLCGDWLVACCAILMGLQLREWDRAGWSGGMAALFEVRSIVIISSLVGGSVFVWLMTTMGTYESGKIYRMRKWMRNLLYSASLLALVAWATMGIMQYNDFSPRTGVVYGVFMLLFLSTLWRLIAFLFLMGSEIRHAACTRIIVVGWNEKVAKLRDAMRRDFAELSEIVGCVPSPGGRFASRPPPELAILGDYSALASHVTACRADSILLADASVPAGEIQQLGAFCQREMLRFRMVPAYFPALISGLQVEMVSGIPILSVSQLPLDRAFNRLLKRGVDVIGGMIGMTIAAILIPTFGAMVYAQSPGPIIYRQLRTSRSGRTFYIYKIRSMKMNAESASGPVWAKADDPRRLKIGAFMRKYNIDEVPQFWNVLKGDMSLVGPRPERPELIESFKNKIPNYNARHEVRAGITGWAQIQGLRGDTDLSKRIAADLYYMENWSLLLDFHCLIATFVRRENAG